MQRQRFIGLVIALAIGASLAFYAYDFFTDPVPRQQREQEVAVVRQARDILRRHVALESELEIVDPIATNRKIGKVYVYPTDDGWQVSGHYQRQGETRWHPWLMTLDQSMSLAALDVQDANPAILTAAEQDPAFTAKP